MAFEPDIQTANALRIKLTAANARIAELTRELNDAHETLRIEKAKGKEMREAALECSAAAFSYLNAPTQDAAERLDIAHEQLSAALGE